MNDYKDADWYDEDYWERSRESGKGGFTGPYTWERLGSYFNATAQHLITSLDLKATDSLAARQVLDVGCAKGYLVKALRLKGIKAFGVDFSTYALAHSDPDTKNFLTRHNVITKNLVDQYDVVTCFDMMEHIPEVSAELVLKRIAKVATRAIVFNIGVTSYEDKDALNMDTSHINIKPREWWVKRFEKCCPGFVLQPEGFMYNKSVWWFNVKVSSFILLKVG